MTERQPPNTTSQQETLTNAGSRDPAEELALAALHNHLAAGQETEIAELITADEISSPDAQRLTPNTRHNIAFFKARFPHRLCRDNMNHPIFAFARDPVEAYVAQYEAAEPLPPHYRGKTITSFSSSTVSIEDVFAVINELEMPIQIFSNRQKLRIEFIDEDYVELLELGLAEKALEASVEPEWVPPSLEEQLHSTTVPNRTQHRLSVDGDDVWNDGTVRVIPITRLPMAPPQLTRAAQPEAIAWQPRYLKNLSPLLGESIPLEDLHQQGLGSNALTALAARHPELRTRRAIGLDEQQRPAVDTADFVLFASWLSKNLTSPERDIPDNWQTLDDIARDANIVLEGEDGLEQWVTDGYYGVDHIVTVPYRDGYALRHLTFCSPQLARMIVDRMLHEQQRIKRAIELAEKYGHTKELPPTVFDTPPDDEPLREAMPNPVVELPAHLRPLETLQATYAIDAQWAYELIAAKYEAYAIGYNAPDNQKRYAHFSTNEGVEYLLQNLAPPDYQTASQVCATYGIPRYLFDSYTDDIELVDDYLSNQLSANVHPMPHYSPEQRAHILEKYFDDIASDPMSVASIAVACTQATVAVRDYLTRHGVAINDDRTVPSSVGLKYMSEHQHVAIADETAFTPTMHLMRTREVRNSDLTHTDITRMCYELGIKTTVYHNATSRKTTQHVSNERLPELQAAILRHYTRFTR